MSALDTAGDYGILALWAMRPTAREGASRTIGEDKQMTTPFVRIADEAPSLGQPSPSTVLTKGVFALWSEGAE